MVGFLQRYIPTVVSVNICSVFPQTNYHAKGQSCGFTGLPFCILVHLYDNHFDASLPLNDLSRARAALGTMIVIVLIAK